MRPDFARDLATGPDRRAGDDEVGSGRGGGVGFDHLVGKSELGDTPPRRGGPRGCHDLAHRALRARRARNRRADQADADQRQAIEQRDRGAFSSRRHSGFAKKSLSAATTRRFASSVPTRQAQRVRQFVGGGLAQDQSARGEERVRVLGGAALGLRKVDQHEIGDARRHFQTELADLFRQPGEPARIVLARTLLMRDVLDRRDAGGDRRPLTLNGPRMRLTASTMCAGPNIQPSRSAASP